MSALAVPGARTLETCVRHSREAGAGLEHVRVRAEQDTGHHRAGTRACHVDVRCGHAPVCDSVANGRNNTERITAAVVRERRVGRNIPARSRARCLRVNEVIPICVGESRVLGTAEVAGRGTRALMKGDDKRQRAGELVRLVVPSRNVVGVRAEVAELDELVLGAQGAESGEEGNCERLQEHLGGAEADR